MAAKTPSKGHWTFDLSGSQFGSPFSDTSECSTSSLQYINAQLVAHGFAHGSGLVLDGLSGEDEGKVVKCLMGLLGQRVDDMSRAEDLTAKLKTLSYECERLMSMLRTAKEEAANAERETNHQKSRMATASRSLHQAELAYKQTTAELQRTRTALQTVRTAHQQELKRKEKDLDRMMERWSKISDSQLKISSNRAGFQCTNLLAVSGSETVGRGRGYLDVALEEAEKSRTALFEENERLRRLLLGTINGVQSVFHAADDSDSEEPSESLTLATLFPLSPADFATTKAEILLEALRSTLSQSTKQTTVMSTPAVTKADSEGTSKHDAQVAQLQETIKSLQEDLEYARAQVREEAQVLFDRFGEGQPQFDRTIGEMSMELIGGPERDEERERLSKIREELDHERAKFTAAAIKFGKEKAVLEAERIQFLEEKRSWQVQQMLADLPTTPDATADRQPSLKGSTHRSPIKAGMFRKKLRISRKSSGFSLSPRKGVIPAFETEVIPREIREAFEQKGAASRSQPLLSGTFVLPPPSPLASIPPHSGILAFAPQGVMPQSELAPALCTNDEVNPFAPLALFRTVPAVGSVELPVITPTEPTLVPPSENVTPVVFRRPFPMAKPMIAQMTHAYSPVKPSPLSRILALAKSPSSPSPFEISLPGFDEAEEFLNPEANTSESEAETYAPRRAGSPLREKRLETNMGLNAGKGSNNSRPRFTAKEKGKGKLTEAAARGGTAGSNTTEKENASRTRLKVQSQSQSQSHPPAVFSAPNNAPKSKGTKSKSMTSVPTSSTSSAMNSESARKAAAVAAKAGIVVSVKPTGLMKGGARRVPVGSTEAAKEWKG